MSDHDEAQVTDHQAEQGGDSKAGNNGAKSRVWLFFIIGLAASMIVGWAVWPTLLYSKKTQPFNFNHVAHTEGAGMDCDECHSYGEDGRFSGVPTFELCLDCHTWSGRQNEESAAETEFLKKFVNEDDELIGDPKWYVYSAQPDCVYFSHIAHTEMGEFTCEQCHGNHGQTTELRPIYINRVTGYSRDVWENMKMTDCGDCHDEHGKPENNACFVCHK